MIHGRRQIFFYVWVGIVFEKNVERSVIGIGMYVESSPASL